MAIWRFAVALILVLPGCAPTYKRSPVVTPQRMMCEGNHPAQITLFSPEEAVLSFKGRSHQLERIETASGVKYGNGYVVFWNKGIDAIITSRGTQSACTYIPRAGL